MRIVRGILLAVALAGGGASAAGAAQDINSQCPDYPGQTHGQILRGVEGRLKGDWNLAIKTTKRSIKRLKDSGQDPGQAELFLTVLNCLQDEVKRGLHADAVEAAHQDPKPEPGTPAPPTKADLSGGGAVQTQTVAAGATPVLAPTVTPAPAMTPAPAPAATAGGIDIAAPAPAPAPAPSGPIIVSSGGVVLPGTAESYGQVPAPAPLPAPSPTPTPQLAVAPSSGDYTGQACAYFTRPYEEMLDGVKHTNRYSEGEWSCNAGTMYACTNGAWENKGKCEKFNRWETRLSTTLEAAPR